MKVSELINALGQIDPDIEVGIINMCNDDVQEFKVDIRTKAVVLSIIRRMPGASVDSALISCDDDRLRYIFTYDKAVEGLCSILDEYDGRNDICSAFGFKKSKEEIINLGKTDEKFLRRFAFEFLFMDSKQ